MKSAMDRSERLAERGWTLIELVITIAVLTILTLGVIPLVRLSVQRQREQRLREALRQIRTAIDEFHRDAIGICSQGARGGPIVPGPQPPPVLDPRSRVMISDCTIFSPENLDLYPPDLETLVRGVSVVPRMATVRSGDPNSRATDNQLLATKKKIYLRAIPIDPMTGRADWQLRSSYDPPDAGSWGGENVFDVRSKSNEMALNGKERYSDW